MAGDGHQEKEWTVNQGESMWLSWSLCCSELWQPGKLYLTFFHFSPFLRGHGLSHLLTILRELFSGIRRARECSVAPARPCKLALASCGSLTYLNPSHTSQRSQDCLLSHLRPTDTRAQVQSRAGHLIWPVWAGSPVEDNAGAGFSCLRS